MEILVGIHEFYLFSFSWTKSTYYFEIARNGEYFRVGCIDAGSTSFVITPVPHPNLLTFPVDGIQSVRLFYYYYYYYLI